MQNVIVGTAGHVDHGKTCLIKGPYRDGYGQAEGRAEKGNNH